MAERRKDQRVPLVLKVEIKERSSLRDVTENLSAGGIFLRTEHKFKQGERATLNVSFPGLLKPVQLVVEVRRIREGTTDLPAGVGVWVPDSEEESRARLHELVQLALEPAASPAPAPEPKAELAPPAPPPAPRPFFTILLVEDNPHVLELFRLALRRLEEGGRRVEVEMLTAENGYDALKLVESRHVDLIIADVYMPVMDGTAMTQKIREMAGKEALPVIAISAHGAEARHAALDAGADVFIAKPVRVLDLLDTVRALLKLGR
jgi:uncharacterized protein (TIGR02266 family)